MITAIFEMGMSEYDRTMIFMPLAEAQRYFSHGPEVDVARGRGRQSRRSR